MNQRIVDSITNKIISKLEAGEIVWKKPWKGMTLPKNYVTLKSYRGINPFVLLIDAQDKGFSSSLWITFKQAKALGGHIKRGSEGSEIIYWKINELEILEAEWSDKDREEHEKTGKTPVEKVPILRSYYVFNYDQTEGLPSKEIVADHKKPIDACERIVRGYKNKPQIVVNGLAYYSPVKDEIGMPDRKQFEILEQYYAVLFHEMTHSTGAGHRLNRKEVVDRNMFGSNDYSREELIAEFGAAYLCALTGVEPKTIENSAAYIQNWLKALKEDKSQLITASARAQRAVDYIQGLKGGE